MLDAFSQKILRLLQRDARRSVQEISEQVGLSSTPCWRRIKDMEQQGIIQRYTALLNRDKLGLHICALIQVQLDRRIEHASEHFEQAMLACTQITECYRTAGDTDYTVKMIAADVDHFDRFLQEHLLSLPTVLHATSQLVLKEVKFETELPL